MLLLTMMMILFAKEILRVLRLVFPFRNKYSSLLGRRCASLVSTKDVKMNDGTHTTMDQNLSFLKELLYYYRLLLCVA